MVRKGKTWVGKEIEKGNGTERKSNREAARKRDGRDRKGENMQRDLVNSRVKSISAGVILLL